MEPVQIWLKPKPTHIDEYFEDFLNYLKSAGSTRDTLYVESLRLLKERVALLVEERTHTPLYRHDKSPECLKFQLRLCGAWLLAVHDASRQERKQVLLVLINNLTSLSLLNTIEGLSSCTYAYKHASELIDRAIRLATCDLPLHLPFTWSDLTSFSLDMFTMKFLKMGDAQPLESWYEGKGLLVTSRNQVTLATFPKSVLDKKYLLKSVTSTPLLPEYGFTISSDKGLQIKESQKDDIAVIEAFVKDILQAMQSFKSSATATHRRKYADGEIVPVEVVKLSPQSIRLRTLDPTYETIEGELVFDANLKIFSKIYPIEVWSHVLKEGERFNAQVNTAHGTFSLTRQFVDYLRDTVSVGDIYDTHNRKVTGGWLKLREFWATAGFLVYVDLSEEEDEELDEAEGYACVEITSFGTGSYEGCLYGRIYDYEVETHCISREEVCPDMIRRFLDEHSDIHLQEPEEESVPLHPDFLHEYCNTLNILQSREVNPMLRYRMLSVMRILCALIDNEKDGQYCQYIARYLQTLIEFAKADSDEGKAVIPVDAPEDLKDEETVTNGADILRILSCFAKGYDETSAILDPYIESDNETLSKTASLVQSYNRLCGLLESKTLRGIKKQILRHLSVVTDGDSTLELSNELEGIFGDEDDMKEFKTSFFEAPANAKEKRQFHNIFRGICALMNNRGGVLYLGVNDKGIPVGVKHDLELLAQNFKQAPTLDAYMLHISRMGEEWFGETCWKYVTLKPINEHQVVSIGVEPYPYDVVYLKDETTYLRKNNASAPITDEKTIEDIRRRRLENLRKTDDKTIILQDAIQKERRVRLVGYRSSNSGTIKNRVVEAFHLDNNEYIHCYEPKSDQVKLFRISRAERVVMLDDSWECKNRHRKLDIDPFYMSGEQKIAVKLRLKLQAKNAIEETYPRIVPYIQQLNSDTWLLDAFTYNLYPLMVFYLSHAPYVEIMEAKGLKEAVLDYVKENLHIG